MTEIVLHSTITCPSCSSKTTEEMPTDACQFFWECPKCSSVIRPIAGDADFRTALAELTPSNVVDNFNTAAPDDERVKYWSYAGVAGRGCEHSTNPFLRLFNNYLYDREGVNDGMVSVQSARWGDYLGEVSADHAQQIGASFPGSSGFSPSEFYASVAELLANHDF